MGGGDRIWRIRKTRLAVTAQSSDAYEDALIDIAALAVAAIQSGGSQHRDRFGVEAWTISAPSRSSSGR